MKVLALIALMVAAASAAEINGATVWTTLTGKLGGPIYHAAGATGAAPFFYRTTVYNVDFDGSPRAYSPKGKAGGALDYTANAGSPGNWYGIVTTNGKASGTPAIQTSSDPAPGFYVSSTSLQDGTKKTTDPRRYVDAATIPYIVLPPNLLNIKGGSSLGASIGDFATVINLKTGVSTGAIVGDAGPHNQIGEGSYATQRAIGATANTVNVLWIVYPGSRRSPTWPVAAATIQSTAASHFASFGGMAKVNAMFGAAAPAAPAVTCAGLHGSCIAQSACKAPHTIHKGLCPGATYCCA